MIANYTPKNDNFIMAFKVNMKIVSYKSVIKKELLIRFYLWNKKIGTTLISEPISFA